MALLLAVFGYLLVPDGTPNANTQLPALSLAPPGTTATLLALKTAVDARPVSWIHRLVNGAPLPYRPLPILDGSFRVQGDSLRAQPLDRPSDTLMLPLELLWNADAPLLKRRFWLGADAFGRCIFSRLVLGYRVSLFVGVLAVSIALTLGLLLGALGGYFGGRTDDVVMLLVNTVWSIPTLLLVFAVVLALGRSVCVVFLAVGLTLWVDVARLVRGQVMALREQAFAEAAYNLGLPPWQIVWRHLLPNLMGPVLVVLASSFATAILLESGLSYLGFGVQPPAPSWGSLLNENYGLALSGRWVAALAPAVAIAVTVWAFTVVGNGLRDALGGR